LKYVITITILLPCQFRALFVIKQVSCLKWNYFGKMAANFRTLPEYHSNLNASGTDGKSAFHAAVEVGVKRLSLSKNRWRRKSQVPLCIKLIVRRTWLYNRGWNCGQKSLTLQSLYSGQSYQMLPYKILWLICWESGFLFEKEIK
jgi:hypothetical protein